VLTRTGTTVVGGRYTPFSAHLKHAAKKKEKANNYYTTIVK
jgi:hypothetical protein